jgi:biopolymer transport protein ExbD
MGAKVSTGGSAKRGQFSENAEPNIIPFVDVMLVLLIIFMVAAPIATVDIKVDLPPSKVLPSKRPPKQTYISIQDHGGVPQYYVGNDVVSSPADLGPMVLKEVPKNNRKAVELKDIIDERIYIRADATTAYRNVVFAMNRIQDEGFFKVALVGEDKRR